MSVSKEEVYCQVKVKAASLCATPTNDNIDWVSLFTSPNTDFVFWCNFHTGHIPNPYYGMLSTNSQVPNITYYLAGDYESARGNMEFIIITIDKTTSNTVITQPQHFVSTATEKNVMKQVFAQYQAVPDPLIIEAYVRMNEKGGWVVEKAPSILPSPPSSSSPPLSPPPSPIQFGTID